MVPGIAAKKGGLARQHTVHLAGFRVGQCHLAAEHIQHFIGAKDGAVSIRVAKSPTAGDAKEQLMNVGAGNINPVGHLTSGLVTP